MENTIGIIVGSVVCLSLFSWLWSAFILGLTGLLDYTRDSDHKLKIDFKQQQ